MSAEPELRRYVVSIALGTVTAEVEAVNADEAMTAAVEQISDDVVDVLCAGTFECREVEA
jgi:hypothetical protein